MTRHRYREEILFCLLIVSLSLKQKENIAVDARIRTTRNDFRVLKEKKKRTRRQWVRVYTPMMTLFLAAQRPNILFRVASATICFSSEMTIT
jgi:hypothetical protein